MIEGLTTTNLTPPPKAPPPSGDEIQALTERQAEAIEDMVAGHADDPEQKATRGGRPALKAFLGVVSKVLDVVKVVLDSVASVLPPGLSHLVGAVSLGVAAADKFGCEMTLNRMNGMSDEQSRKLAGMDFGMEALGTAMSTVPGAGLASGAVQTVTREGAELAVKEGAEAALKREVKDAALDGLVDGVSTEVRQELQLQAQH
jgi:hypothetical protein